MLAERVTVETDAEGNPAGMPKLPPNSKFEVIFLLLDEPSSSQPQQATPREAWRVSPKIAGKGRILGDIVAPVIPDTDWEVLR